jgi:hypothetical protein
MYDEIKKKKQQSGFNTREWLMVRLRKSEKGAKKKEEQRNETGISLKKNCLIFVKCTFMTFAKQRPKEKTKKK